MTAADDASRDLPTAWFDWLTWPLLVLGGLAATAAAVPRMSTTLVPVAVPVGMIAILLVLERSRPQRPRPQRRAESLWAELGHVAVGLELGSVLGYAAAAAVGAALAPSTSDRALAGWPLVAEVGLGLLIVDVVSYLHHRLMHRIAVLWPFHALHHQPRELDLLKLGRFHLVDIATFALLAYAPLLALGPSAAALAWVATIGSIASLLQHANVRMPTPAWLDALLCTPAVHWRHHGRAKADDGNYAGLFMLIDRALGTWVATGGRRPAQLGLDDDPLPPGWLAAIVAPLRLGHRR